MNIGIEIGGTKIQVVSGRADGTIEERHRFVVDKSQGAAGIQKNIEQILQALPQRPTAIGVGFGGPVNHETGQIATSHQIEGWSGFNLKGWLEKLTGAPVTVENDANVAALGEALCGAGKGYSHVFYITLGSGVGGGMVNQGRLFHSAFPGEAEVGHVRMNKQGDSLESVCSGWALNNTIREVLPSLPESSYLKKAIGEATTHEARYLAEALQHEDPAAEELLLQYADNLAFGLSHVVHLFHPDIIILGGGVSLIGDPLLRAVRQILPTYVVSTLHPVPVIALSQLGEDVVPTGALLLTNY
ncbi:ROK family protein [Telluribacter sp. SYSU D00476]|uniref:ROK family protein n=1 Tax=Telluribacter sp. SYSU D00476 TaxID=2811430 RepID=UPI001FF587FB|nr:ROK family protein [Telluribacter sp. SYSU D00476]